MPPRGDCLLCLDRKGDCLLRLERKGDCLLCLERSEWAERAVPLAALPQPLHRAGCPPTPFFFVAC